MKHSKHLYCIKSTKLAIFVTVLGLSSCDKEDTIPIPPDNTSFTTSTEGILTDVDGNEYAIRKIEDEWWMIENLATTKFRNGDQIPLVIEADSWQRESPAYCWYNNDSSTFSNPYGALYNWFAVATGDLCPTGWHVPLEAEFLNLADLHGGALIAGGKLKESGSSHWLEPNTGATNESGFTALPAGSRLGNGFFTGLGEITLWWSATQYHDYYAQGWQIVYDGTYLGENMSSKFPGRSVRCVKD